MGACYDHLNDWDRTRLMELRAKEFSIRTIARMLKPAPSSVLQSMGVYRADRSRSSAIPRTFSSHENSSTL